MIFFLVNGLRKTNKSFVVNAIGIATNKNPHNIMYYVNCIKRDQNKAVVNPAYPKKAYIEAMSAIANNNTFRTLISVSFLR